jgi:phosphoglycolate phosphatase
VPEAIAARASGVRVTLTSGVDRQVTDSLLAAIGWRVGAARRGGLRRRVATGRPAADMIEPAMELTRTTVRGHGCASVRP